MVNTNTTLEGTSLTVESRISQVTVYSNQARVTRRTKVSLTGQEQELVIPRLPMTIETESVRATGSGTGVVRLLGVRTEKVFDSEPVGEQVAQLSGQIKELEKQKRQLEDQLASKELAKNFVEALTDKAVQHFSRSIAQQQIGLQETSEFLNFLEQRHHADASAIAQQEEQQQELQKQLNALKAKLQQLKTPRPQESLSIIVTLAAEGAVDFDLEVSYVVNRASWIPLYDLRTNSSSDRINLSYLAQVKQNTGEDWSNVSLTLSTAKPGLGTLPPKLEPWYIGALDQQPTRSLRREKMRAMSSSMSELSPDQDYEDESEALKTRSAPQAMLATAKVAAQTVVAVVSTEGGVVTFELDGNSNIPSDGSPHKVTIFSDEYPSNPEYLAIPRLVSFAYLQTVVTNPTTGATLLPGKANIFRDQTFVGTTKLENISPGQEFRLNLGIDEGVKIERDLVERQVDKKLIGNQRRTTYAYRLVITNLQSVQKTLVVKEQLPVSRDERIKVRLTQTNPKIQTGEMGLLEWKIDLSAQDKQELYYQFIIEHSPELKVIGLDI
ncbi:mucoidy inhibitor MuiA family protein [Moorena sp. SIO3I6]|uniref:mucoidy inhibitor MuiA family protein n=1 Tax=Moorena sp. SIO3I6 TaxID=2607831 RepID=UPI0013FC83A9|nr:mucoidy inhibitor MuiA family protein [Moorena sp. SIO3I6]NEP22738.1 mucoidy inhibitor MuiA family protein [Moorena sp. SIO3I6]